MSDALIEALGANAPAVVMLALVVFVVPQILKAHGDGVTQSRLTAEQAREVLKDERAAMQTIHARLEKDNERLSAQLRACNLENTELRTRLKGGGL